MKISDFQTALSPFQQQLRFFIPFGMISFLAALAFYFQKAEFSHWELLRHISVHMLFIAFVHFVLISILAFARRTFRYVLSENILASIYAIFTYIIIFISFASAVTFHFWLTPVNSILIRNFLFHLNHYTSLSFPGYSYLLIFILLIVSILMTVMLFRAGRSSLDVVDNMPQKTQRRIGQIAIPGILLLGILVPMSVQNAEYFKRRFISLKEGFIVHDPVIYTFYLALRRHQLRNIIYEKEKEIDSQLQVPGVGRSHRRNVILITIDALRADYVNDKTKRSNLMPCLDSLLSVSSAIIYTQAYANSNYSSTGLLSILEGRVSNIMEEKGLSLQHYLKKAGYKNYFILSGSHAGFNHLDIRYGNNVDFYFEGPFSNRYPPDNDEVIFEGLEYLNLEEMETPDFMWIHMMGVHYVSVRDPKFKKFYPDDFSIWGKANAANTLRYINNYKNGILETDVRIGRILERLNAQGLLQNSIIIVTSDHGENLGEYAELGHSRNLSPEQLQIPFIIVDDGLDSTEVVSKFISQLDFPRLIVSTLQLSVPDQWLAKVEVVPVVSAVAGQTGNILRKDNSYYLQIFQDAEYTGKEYFLLSQN